MRLAVCRSCCGEVAAKLLSHKVLSHLGISLLMRGFGQVESTHAAKFKKLPEFIPVDDAPPVCMHVVLHLSMLLA